jgi:murein DD-endopeptidase MepM/ murein hydrolase activator NlpD
LRVLESQPPTALSPADTEGLFPVRGTYDFGTATNRFGGGRGHQGQDVFAACATEVVAAREGRVTQARYETRAGNFAVIGSDDGMSQVYMHMQRRPLVHVGERVTAGTPVGAVGQTGSAHGCHLHFELWTAPGWYAGGHAVDPLPSLRRWSRAS